MQVEVIASQSSVVFLRHSVHACAINLFTRVQI